MSETIHKLLWDSGFWIPSKDAGSPVGHRKEGWDELGRVCHGLFPLYCNVSFLVWLLLPRSNPEYRLCGFEGDISFRNESAQPGIRREKWGGNGKKKHRGLEWFNPRGEGKRWRECLRVELQFSLSAGNLKLEPEQNMHQRSCESGYECP